MIVEPFRRAFADTIRGQIAALFVLAAGGGLSLLYLYVTENPTVAAEEITYVTGTVLGALGALFLLFLWNLACAPYRIVRDRNKELEAQAQYADQSSLKDFIRGRRFFTIKEAACLLAGEPLKSGG